MNPRRLFAPENLGPPRISRGRLLRLEKRLPANTTSSEPALFIWRFCPLLDHLPIGLITQDSVLELLGRWRRPRDSRPLRKHGPPRF